MELTKGTQGELVEIDEDGDYTIKWRGMPPLHVFKTESLNLNVVLSAAQEAKRKAEEQATFKRLQEEKERQERVRQQREQEERAQQERERRAQEERSRQEWERRAREARLQEERERQEMARQQEERERRAREAEQRLQEERARQERERQREQEERTQQLLQQMQQMQQQMQKMQLAHMQQQHHHQQQLQMPGIPVGTVSPPLAPGGGAQGTVQILIRGVCGVCGQNVYNNQDRQMDPVTGVYSHRDPQDCKVIATVQQPAWSVAPAAAQAPTAGVRPRRWGDGIEAPAAGTRHFVPPGFEVTRDVAQSIAMFGHSPAHVAEIVEAGRRKAAMCPFPLAVEHAAALYAYTEETPLYGTLNYTMRTPHTQNTPTACSRSECTY